MQTSRRWVFNSVWWLPLALTLGHTIGCGSTGSGGDAADATTNDLAPIDAADGDTNDATPNDSTDVPVDLGPPPPRRHIVDTQGRAVILHGINVDSYAKDDPEHSPRLGEPDVRRMREQWGFNFVRYLIFWDLLEPMPGQISTAYLDRIAQRMDWFAAHGIYVLIDMHQDVYARRFCCDGAPNWAIRDDGEPFVPQPQWFLNYFQPAVQRAFDNFWNYDGPNRDLQDHYGDVWVAVATRFRTHPAVIGYDLINEPSPGSQFEVVETLTGVGAGTNSRSGRFDRDRLGTFYQRLIRRIRTVDSDHWIFVEPRYGGPGNGAITYLPVLDDPRAGEDRIVFAPHLYSIPYEQNMRYDPAADRAVARWEVARSDETRAQNWPIVAGEFGMDRTFPGAERYLDDILEMTERLHIGWAYWSWDPGTWAFWDPTSMTEQPNIASIVRVYPQRVAGDPSAWAWDRRARVFTLAFTDRAGVTGPTEIFLAADRFYASGYVVESSTDASGSWTQMYDSTRRVLSLDVRANAAGHRFTIRPM